MKILLAGPGTGKTTKIKKIISEQYSQAKKIKVISFTNATVNDLIKSFEGSGNVNCSTLHSFALSLNHLPNDMHIIDNKIEKGILDSFSEKLNIDPASFLEMVKCITFNGMVASCVAFIKANPTYAENKLGRLDLLLVDEFQDFNPDEQELVMLISKLATETIILGDDDQSIYGFKDADPDGIIALYNNAAVEKIPHDNICYRCPDSIVEYGTKLIRNNNNRIEKEWKKYGNTGDLIFKQLSTQEQSDDFILSAIQTIRSKFPIASILILSRLGIVVGPLKDKLKNNKIEFIDCWNEKWEIDTLSKIWWLNAIYGPNKLPFILFLLKYCGNISKPKLLTLLGTAFQNGTEQQLLIKQIIDLKYLPEQLALYILNPPAIQTICDQHTEFEFLKEHINENAIKESISRLTSKVKVNKEFEKEKINFMSIHKSKGLQADFVIINGLVSGILPNETFGLDTIEAQRRLLFVGMTRALKELYLVSTVEWEGRVLKKQQSRYETIQIRILEKKIYSQNF